MDNQKPKFFQTHSFKALKDKWYGRLKEKGFTDIERDEEYLQSPSTRFSRGENLDYDKSKEEYYRLAGHFLHDHRFVNDTERRVWELHSNGMSADEIAKRMVIGARKDLEPRNTTGGYATNRKKVQATIRRLAKEMIEDATRSRT